MFLFSSTFYSCVLALYRIAICMHVDSPGFKSTTHVVLSTFISCQKVNCQCARETHGAREAEAQRAVQSRTENTTETEQEKKHWAIVRHKSQDRETHRQKTRYTNTERERGRQTESVLT